MLNASFKLDRLGFFRKNLIYLMKGTLVTFIRPLSLRKINANMPKKTIKNVFATISKEYLANYPQCWRRYTGIDLIEASAKN
jgi:hypothetical protein